MKNKKDGDSRSCRSSRAGPSWLETAGEDLEIYQCEGGLVGRDTFDVNGVVEAHIVFES